MKPFRLTPLKALICAFALIADLSLPLANAQSVSQTGATVNAATRAEVIEGALRALNDEYVFPETAKKMEQAVRERAGRKEYDGITSAAAFAATLTAHLQEVSRDKHLRVIFDDGSRAMLGGGPNPPNPMDRESARMMSAKRNFGFEKVERLGGNIGYLDLRGFEDPVFAADTAAAAMSFLANTDALIIDLRQNGGGHPESVAFISGFLFDKRTHLNDIYERPTNRTREFWTREDAPGKRYGDKPVYVLTSNRTFSAAEEFTYNLKNLKRATIIGETTGGGAHPVNPRRLGKNFLITVPFARAINPITKTNWEGVGVKPDVETPAEKALKVAHLAALKSALPKTNDQTLADQLKSMIESLQKEVGEIALPASFQPPAQQTANAASQVSKPPATETDGEMIERLNAIIDKRVADDSFSGVVMIAKDGKPIFQRAVGLASKSYNVPNRVDTKFNLGSINKFFTRIAISQLIEQGKLSLNDTIGKHLPDYPNKEAAAKVTIKHLLDMQSGIGDFFGPKFDATPKNRIRATRDYLPLFADQPLKFEPGTSRAYSNGGYIVLGAIIEKVTGQSYYDYVRDRIFKPAGMENTDSFEVDVVTPNLATGYTRDSGGVRVSNVYTKPARGSSAGGGYSTAEDLLKFIIALKNNKLLGATQTKRILQGGVGVAGGAPGINAALEIDQGGVYTVIVLSNYDPPSATDVSQQVRKWIPNVRE